MLKLRWDKKTVDKLIKLHGNHLNDYQIAKELGKTRDAVKNKRNSLGLPANIIKQSPKILIFDIETSYMSAYVFEIGKQYLTIDNIEKDWNMICFSAKWLGEEEVITSCQTPSEAKRGDDKRIVKDLWNLFNEADILVAHNGDMFDVRKANARFLKHGLPMPSPYKTVDTYRAAFKAFGTTSHKLDYLCEYLGIPKKLSTGGRQLWIDCLKGDKDALDKMLEYNINDVVILEQLYLRILPYITSHPNVALYKGFEHACKNCGSQSLHKDGIHYANRRKYQAYRCDDCGAITIDSHCIK